jgi:hypothetical protein
MEEILVAGPVPTQAAGCKWGPVGYCVQVSIKEERVREVARDVEAEDEQCEE